MKTSRQPASLFALLVCLAAGRTGQCSSPLQATPPAQATPATAATTALLTRDQTAGLLPATVFYRGQVAHVQGRNSAGLRLAGGKLLLATLVDNSGYASSVQQTYQGYLLSEFPLRLGTQTLPAGAYGFGFLGTGQMFVLDLGGTELLRAATTRDPQMSRPNPLQMLHDPSSSQRFRLYLGRDFVTLEAAALVER